MSPKITVHGGPSDKGDLPKAKTYGQMLAEARGAEPEVVAGTVVAPGLVFVLDDPAPQLAGEPGPELDVPEVPEEAAPVQETATEPEPAAEASVNPEPEAEPRPVKKAAKKTAAKKVSGKASAVLEMGGGDG